MKELAIRIQEDFYKVSIRRRQEGLVGEEVGEQKPGKQPTSAGVCMPLSCFPGGLDLTGLISSPKYSIILFVPHINYLSEQLLMLTCSDK